MLARTYFDARDAYAGNTTKERRRVAIAQELITEVTVVPPSRLLALLGQSLKWQQHQGLLPPGTKFDLFRGTAPSEVAEDEHFPTQVDRVIKIGTKSHAECARFSPDGQYLVTGSMDGFVEVWDYMTGKLNKSLPYQANDEFMMHDASVLCLAWSRDSEYLASGSQDGKLKVWQIRTGKCMRKFEQAHAEGITCLAFARDGSQVLSGSFDSTLRMHGLKSGKTIKIFRGHTSYVNDCLLTPEGTRVLSASSDGCIKVWDVKTAECLQTIKPGGMLKDTTVTSVFMLPKNIEHIVVCTKSPNAQIITLKGQVVKTYSCTKKEMVASGAMVDKPADIVCSTLSPRGDYLYCVTEDSTLFAFNLTLGTLENTLKLHEKDTIGVTHHPHRNLLASFGDDGTLKLWKP